MTQNLIVVETRRSKGIHKADLTNLDKDTIKALLGFYGSNSYVALMNFRTNYYEIKFERMTAKGMVKYCLKVSLTDDDFKALGFSKSENGNWHYTQQGCSISRFDVKLVPPVKKVSAKKEKAEKKEKNLKAPLPPKSKEENTEEIEKAEEVEAKEIEETKTEVKKAKAPLPAMK